MNPASDIPTANGLDIDPEYLQSGTALLNGQYVIESYLSSGGFGITYLARDSLDRPVVIKECYPEALCSRKNKTVRARSVSHANEFQSLVGMFIREARNIAKLQHPNIVGVHQIFEDNETAYMALDLIKGQDLLRILEDRPDDLTPTVVVALLEKLLNAIVAVHEQDMLHRDISPDNILLDGWGNPVLIDFGAAREHASKKSRAVSAFLVVKDGYSPQEFYISGGQQGPSSDLYSLAATFVHLITGEAPPNSQTRIAAIAANRPDPYQHLSGRIKCYEPSFLAALDMAMNVFPADRMQSARDWIEMIDPAKAQIQRKAGPLAATQMQKIIADLVTETTLQIEQDLELTPPPKVATIETPKTPERVWEYLSATDPEAEALAAPDQDIEPDQDATPDQPRSYAFARKLEPATPQGPEPGRARRRKLGLVVVVSALGINIFTNPSNNIATNSVPELQNMLDRGLSLAPRLGDLFTSFL